MTLTIGISIINYKTAELTINCAASCLADIGDLPVQIAIVDNASGDGSADQIADWIADQPDGTPVTLVRSEVNTGFSGGHNQGLAALSDCDHVLLLNSDGVLRPGFLALMSQAAAAHPKAGLIAPEIQTDDGAVQVSCFRFLTPTSEFIRGANLGPVTKALARREVSLPLPPDPAQIEWVSFACVLLNMTMVREIGPMDEGYFLYFEDGAYCLHAARAGWGIVQESDAKMVHYRGGSGPVKTLNTARKRLPPYYYASRTRFFRQAHGPTGPLRANLAWTVGRCLTQIKRLTSKPVLKANKSEVTDLWTNALNPLGPRRAPWEDARNGQ